MTAQLLPSDTFYLTAEFREKYPGEAAQWGPANRELDDSGSKDPADTSPQRLAADFGVPHPTLAESYSAALLTSEPFPVSGGYGSRLFGESWESSNLYWARLADEKGYPPAMLNILVPELTRQMVANISATSIDDWPALLRAMQQTGEEFRQGKINIHTASSPRNQPRTSRMGDTHVNSKRYRIVVSAGACLGILLSGGGGSRFAAQDERHAPARECESGAVERGCYRQQRELHYRPAP